MMLAQICCQNFLQKFLNSDICRARPLRNWLQPMHPSTVQSLVFSLPIAQILRMLRFLITLVQNAALTSLIKVSLFSRSCSCHFLRSRCFLIKLLISVCSSREDYRKLARLRGIWYSPWFGSIYLHRHLFDFLYPWSDRRCRGFELWHVLSPAILAWL